jgi:4-amino-4-deoxy-L-arabinose transferase-like glycosyltransferase
MPAFFQERPPYIFCDEQIYPWEALRMFELGIWITSEFKAGGLNVYTLLPFLHVADFFEFAPNSTNVIDLARSIQTVIIGGSTSVFIYLSGKKLFKSESYGYVSGIFFIVSPGFYAYSRFAYPDHFIYFFRLEFYIFLSAT